MINYQPFLDLLDREQESSAIIEWRQQLPEQINKGLSEKRYGDLPRWKGVLDSLPNISTDSIDLNNSAVIISTTPPLDDAQKDDFKTKLMGLHPWRKGPFNLFDVNIDTEWRSDWKWQRLQHHISPLNGRKVLDIGCGSGYHCWRMRGDGAELVIGIDPTPLFIVQFFTLQKYIQDHHVTVLPMGIEHLPEKMHYFDTVFSMGVLYHRRSPFDHLIELKNTLRPGGELVLETLVIEGEHGEALVPEGRYAKMGNVWFLPSSSTLTSWLKKVGFTDISVVDVCTTTTDEQRSTEWMTFHSLAQFLDPQDSSKTIEGYPAPRRAIVTAKSP